METYVQALYTHNAHRVIAQFGRTTEWCGHVSRPWLWDGIGIPSPLDGLEAAVVRNNPGRQRSCQNMAPLQPLQPHSQNTMVKHLQVSCNGDGRDPLEVKLHETRLTMPSRTHIPHKSWHGDGLGGSQFTCLEEL